MDLGDTAIGQRILQVSWHVRLPDPAAVQQLAQAVGGRLQARVRPLGQDRGEGSTGWRGSPPSPARPPRRAHRRGARGRGRRRLAMAVENALLSITAMPSPASSVDRAVEQAGSSARAIGARSAWPTDPSIRTVDRPVLVQRLDDQLASSGRTPVIPRARLFASRRSVPRTISRLAGGPLADAAVHAASAG